MNPRVLMVGAAESAPSSGPRSEQRDCGMALIGAILLAVFVLPPPWRVPVVLAGGAIEVAESAFWVWLSKRRRPAVGVETLVGAIGTVVSPCEPVGQVRVGGELWRAQCDGGAEPGDEVRVVGVEGLTLRVRR